MCMLGFRFSPTDEELVDHFLKHKIAGDDDFIVNNIAHIQLFNFAPWDLPGLKRTLVFNKCNHEKIKWVIHEYHANEAIFPHNKTNLVLSRLMKKDEHVTDSTADFEKQPTMDLAQYNKTIHTLGTMRIGYRFHPTDEDILSFYLKNKLVGNDSLVSNIHEVNLNITEPCEFTALSKITSNDLGWYFFTTDVLKYKKGTKCKRTTNAGSWKKTGKTREIKFKGTVIGTKKILLFYKYCGSHVVKTNWVIHQYDAIKVHDNKRNFVLCRLTDKTQVERDELMYDEGASSHVAAGAELESIAATDLTPNACGSPEVNLEYNLLLASPREDDFSFPEYSFHAATNQTPYFEIENNNADVGFPYELNQEDINADYNSFFNSNLEDGDVYISEGTR